MSSRPYRHTTTVPITYLLYAQLKRHLSCLMRIHMKSLSKIKESSEQASSANESNSCLPAHPPRTVQHPPQHPRSPSAIATSAWYCPKLLHHQSQKPVHNPSYPRHHPAASQKPACQPLAQPNHLFRKFVASADCLSNLLILPRPSCPRDLSLNPQTMKHNLHYPNLELTKPPSPTKCAYSIHTHRHTLTVIAKAWPISQHMDGIRMQGGD